MSDTTGKDDELEQTYRQEAQYALHLLSLPAEDRPVHIMLRAKELLDVHKQHGTQEHDRAIEEVKKAGYGYDDGTGFVLKISFAELAALKTKQEVAN